MGETNREVKKIKLYIYGLFTLIIMVVIFAFSSQRGEESSELSEETIRVMLGIIDGSTSTFLGRFIQEYIRKIAHFVLYMLLGYFATLTGKEMNLPRKGLWGWLFATLYAFTDELHQYFIPGRMAQMTDVMLDSIGAFVGVEIVVTLIAWVRKRTIINKE